MNRKLILVRGLPGSGKTTFVQTMMSLIGEKGIEVLAREVSADDFMYADGQRFDPKRLPECHDACQKTVEWLLRQPYDETVVFVHNTFTQEWEMEPYFKIAERTGAKITTIVIENRHENESVHNVPDSTIKRMKERFSLKL